MSDKLQGGIKAGSTSVSVSVILRKTADNTEKTGVAAAGVASAYYWRQGGTPTALTALSDLAAITTAFAAGGWKEADATHANGAYRLDVDDAAFATGADWVQISVVVATCYVFHERFALTTNVVQTGDSFARLGAPAGASIAADVAAVKTDTAAVKVQTDKLTFTVPNQVDSNVLDWKSATAPAMTGDAFARLGAPAGASTAADIAAVKTDTAAVKVQTDKLTFTLSNKVDANALAIGGTTQTGRDLGASVLLSAGTGAGQLDFTFGVVKANLAQILGTALTETAGQIAAAFKKFFNIATPASTMDALTLVSTATNLTNAPTAGDFTATMKTSLNAATPASVQNISAQTGDSFARLGAPAGASVSADIAAVQTIANSISGRIPSALSANNNMKSDLEEIAGNTGGASRFDRSARAIVIGAVGSASTTTNIVTSALSPSAVVSGQFIGRILIFDKDTTTAHLRGQATNITASDASGNLTIVALTDAPVSGDTFTIT